MFEKAAGPFKMSWEGQSHVIMAFFGEIGSVLYIFRAKGWLVGRQLVCLWQPLSMERKTDVRDCASYLVDMQIASEVTNSPLNTLCY